MNTQGPGEPNKRQPSTADCFGAIPVATMLIDPENRIARANTAAELLLNMSERAMAGRALFEIMTPPTDYALRRPELGFAAYDAEISAARGGIFRADFIEAISPDFPGWRILTLHQTPPGRRVGWHSDRGAGARAAIGAAAMLAHEIKNPLSGIRGAAQLLAEDQTSDPVLTTLITTEVDRIAALIDRMEDFTDTRPLDLQPQSIYPLLAHARQLALAGFGRGMPIEERYDPSLPDVLIDRDAFLQILLNLLKNAAEASRTNGMSPPQIGIATNFRHGMSIDAGAGQPRRPLPIEIAVFDNGAGVPPDIAEHMFEPFVSGKPEGKGLGLPLVVKLTREMGGIVQYSRETRDDPVTIFRIFLPRADP